MKLIAAASVWLFRCVVDAADPRLPFWPTKNGNSQRTGQSTHSAPFDISQPTWVWEEPDRPRTSLTEAMYSSPMLDADRNTYIASTTGRVYALDVRGHLLWNYTTSSGSKSCGTYGCGSSNVALHNGVLFSSADDGFAYALDASTGRELWRTATGFFGCLDVPSPLVVRGLVVVPACSIPWIDGSDLVVALDIDGHKLWSYELPTSAHGFNFMPAAFEDSIVFPDRAGGLYRILIADGSEVWRVPPPEGYEDTETTNGLALGPGGTAYVGSGDATSAILPGRGFLIAYNLADGSRLWTEDVEGPVNQAPAVGTVFGHDVVAVVAALGNNPLYPGITWKGHNAQIKGSVEARNALTGDLLWVFRPGVFNSSGNAGWKEDDQLLPDLFSPPSIGADGTVYISWSGGWAYALRDANGDGEVDLLDPTEVSRFFHNGGASGQSAIAPGFLVASSCWKLFGFVGEDLPPPAPTPPNDNAMIIA